jgi:uncharacterized protein YegJ (DUF2314 family)
MTSKTAFWSVAFLVLGLLGGFVHARDGDEIQSVVLFQLDHVAIDDKAIVAAFKDASGQDVQVEDFRDEKDVRLVTINDEPYLFINRNRRYFEATPETVEALKTAPEGLRRAMLDHQAWLSVDIFGPVANDRLKQRRAVITKVAARFVRAEKTLGLFVPDSPTPVPYTPELLDVLTAGNYEELLFLTGRLQRPADQKKMDAAVAEAKQRLPEFLAAFEKRTPDARPFVIKYGLKTEEKTEYIWAAVKSIDNAERTLTATLANTPVHDKDLKEGSEVTVDYDTIVDWFYFAGDDRVGGFTVKVLEGK